ncbi:MAG TPA: hypothetical protein DEG43_10975 [Acidimicrobiaceae bacterium]|jgi:DNA polymerase-3 subunit delta|nr:hypothetical protein [Acidimicrobiaceae bacterium]
MNEPILLLKGNDPVLLADGAAQAIDEIVGDRVRTEVLDLFVGDDYELTDAVIAASAASMFGDRVIVIRNASRFNTEALTPLLNYVADPNPTSTVVVVWDKPATPSASGQPVNKKLVEAVKKSGGKVQDCDVAANARVRQGWLDERIGESALLLTPAARTVILQRLGDDVSRLPALLRLLEGAFPLSQRLTPDDVAPYLGEAGAIPPWDLTDAIDKGDVAAAIGLVRRMTGGGQRHPLQIMVTIVGHYQKMMRLDGSGVRSEVEAAELLGMKKGSTFPAKKAMQQGKKLGSEKLAAAIQLLATADADLRGATAIPAEAVLEVLVGRLARLSASR